MTTPARTSIALLIALLGLPAVASAGNAGPEREPRQVLVKERSLDERVRLWETYGTPEAETQQKPMQLREPQLVRRRHSSRPAIGWTLLTLAGLSAGLTTWGWGAPDSYGDFALSSGLGALFLIPARILAPPATLVFASLGAKVVADGYFLEGAPRRETHLYGGLVMIPAICLTFGYLMYASSRGFDMGRTTIIASTVGTWLAFTATAITNIPDFAPDDGEGDESSSDPVVLPFVAPDGRETAVGLAFAGTL